MFKRIQQMHISLAAKCQLLFGAAVALIISAALFVPWQRMEQLTGQINERAARALCDDAIADHIAGAPANAWMRQPSTMPWPATSQTSATSPSGGSAHRLGAASPSAPATALSGPRITQPHLAMLWPRLSGGPLTGFEKASLRLFGLHPDMEYHDRIYAEQRTSHYHYVRALHVEDGCLQCHGASRAAAPAPPLGGAASSRAAASGDHRPSSGVPRASAGGPAPQPAPGTVIGIVSIDMRSQLDENQLLLNRIFILTAGLLAGTLAIVVFYLITTRLILQPVHVLQETAEKVSKGDLNIRSHISTGDEFEQLSTTFNVMLANLSASQDQLRAMNKSLDLKLGQLAQSNVALYESNRLKSEFLANVSHELRTPLNSILGFAELLKDASPPDARTVRYLQNILTSGQNLLELINDLLDLAKIEAGRMEVRSAPLSLNDLFEGLTSIIKPLAQKQQVQVSATVAADVPIIHSDGPKLQQVLYNFLSNAIKFSPPGGRIELRADREDAAHVRLSVSDEGPGIQIDQQQIIFEKFRQIDGSVTRQHGGTGLGLAISKELVTLLSGAIGVSSTPGSGATFWVVIPLEIAAGPQDVRRNLVLM